MRKRKSNIFLILILIVGLSLLLYPPVSNWWNSYRQSKVVSDYAENVSHLDNEEYQRILNDARAYNEAVAAYGGGAMTLSDEQRADYLRQLDVDGSGIMGYIDIQKIRCTLPIYHGTDDGVLQIAIGHIEGSSLPVGGESTHCVLSGHRGLPSARLFTDIDQLVEGDTFLIRTLDEVLTYEVDQIRIVLPREVGDLCVEPGKDLCTLVTCTPYGVNSHRLLVRGQRVDSKPGTLAITAEAFQIRPVVVMPAIAIPLLLLLLIAALIWSGRRSPQRIMNEHRKAREEKQHK